MLPEEQQKQRKEKDKSNPFNPLGNGGDKSPRKGPRISLYWIYGIIIAVLVGVQYINGGNEIKKTTEKEFREQMYLKGDVDHIESVQNSLLIRVYIKTDSLTKQLYKQQ